MPLFHYKPAFLQSFVRMKLLLLNALRCHLFRRFDLANEAAITCRRPTLYGIITSRLYRSLGIANTALDNSLLKRTAIVFLSNFFFAFYHSLFEVHLGALMRSGFLL